MDTDTVPAKPQRLQVSIANRQIAMLDRLAIDIRERHGVVISRAAILCAIVEAGQRNGWADTLLGKPRK